MPLHGITESFRLNHAMDKDRGSDDMFRMDRADRNNFFNFGDGRSRSHSHDGIKISGGEAISQISQFVGGVRFDQGVIGVNRKFQNATFAFEDRKSTRL